MEIEVGLQSVGGPYAKTLQFAVGSVMLTFPVLVVLTVIIGVLTSLIRQLALIKVNPDSRFDLRLLWLDVPWVAAAIVSGLITCLIMLFILSGDNRYMLPQFMQAALWG